MTDLQPLIAALQDPAAGKVIYTWNPKGWDFSTRIHTVKVHLPDQAPLRFEFEQPDFLLSEVIEQQGWKSTYSEIDPRGGMEAEFRYERA